MRTSQLLAHMSSACQYLLQLDSRSSIIDSQAGNMIDLLSLSFSMGYMYASVETPLSRLFWQPFATLF